MRSKDDNIKELKHSLSIEKEDAVKVMLRGRPELSTFSLMR